MREAAAGLSAILDVEMDLRVKLCAGWGVPIGNLVRLASGCESGDAVVRCGTFAD